MKDFAALFARLDQTTRTSVKTAALADYLRRAPEADRLWTIALFSGRRPKRTITTARLRDWASEAAGLPLWLIEESYGVVGDLAETIALVLPPPQLRAERSLADWIAQIQALAPQEEEARKAAILRAWDQLPPAERLVFNKLITGGFRIGVSRKLMTRALAQATGREEADLAHRLMGDWRPDTVSWDDLIHAENSAAAASRPYPFCLAHGLEGDPATLGPPQDWCAEWKWDGIRGQLIVRGGTHYVWSRGEELMTDRFPELAACADLLPGGTVLDGELLAWAGDGPLPFAALQKRIGRKSVPKSLLRDAPVRFCAYDLLEWQGEDWRARPFATRRAALEQLIADLPPSAALHLSQPIAFDNWDRLATLRAGARARRAEGVMLKSRAAPYRGGRHKGDWWKWKLDPLRIDAVMIYAQAGHGRRANLFTDYTFAVWDGPDLVPFTKAYSGLTDAEFGQISAWVRRNTLERFGPVRRVTPHHVFEIAFEGIQASARHKSGIALRFPRMARWRQDKPLQEAGTLAELQEMLRLYG